MGQIISVQTFILGILGKVNRQFKQNDEASIRQEIENNLKSLRLKHMNLSYIYVEQKRKIMAHAIMMEELDKDWSKMFDYDRDIEDVCDYDCTNKVDIAFKGVENSLDAILYDIRRSQAEIIGRIEGYQFSSIHQEEPRYIEAVQLVASLMSTFNDFANQTCAINNLALRKRIPELEKGIFEYLKDCILPQPGSMYSLLTDLIDRQFTIPQHKDDNLSLGMLDLLCSGIDVYLYMLAFLLQQYTILCHTYYHKNDLDKYNEYYISGANAFDYFSSTLADLSDKIVNVLVTVENLQFIRSYRKDVTDFIARKFPKLKPIKRFLLDNYPKLVQVNRPDFLNPNLNYTSSEIETPILEWANNSALSYAIQFMGNSVEPYSMNSLWSNDTVGSLANPLVSIYRDPRERARVIFRKIANDSSQIVAVIIDAQKVVFRDIDRDLYNAVLKLDENEALKYVKIYLDNGANASAVFENSRRAIHAAAQNNQWTVAEVLIKTDANLVNAFDDNGYTPIYIATEAGHDNFVTNLLNDKGIDVNVPTSKKNHQLTALHCAVYKGHDKIVKKLLQFPLIDVNAKTTDGFTALHFASFCYSHGRDLEIISMLFNDTRIDFNVLSGQIEVPLFFRPYAGSRFDVYMEWWIHSGNVSPLQIASKSFTKPAVDGILNNNKTNQTRIHSKTNDGSNVLHLAAFNMDEKVLSALEAHMNINETVDSQNDREFTPLYNSCYCSNELTQEKLLNDYCASVDIRLSNNKTLLHLAAIQGHDYAATKLISYGASVSAIDAHVRSPLHYAVWLGDLEVIKALLSEGASTKAIDLYDNPVIHLVINLTEDKALAIIRMFVDSDKTLDLNVKGALGNRLLHYMCALEYVSVVKYLLSAPKINTNVVNHDGETLLHVAAFVGNYELINMLINRVKMHSPNPNQCTSVGCYAIKGKGNIKIVDLLEQLYPELIEAQELVASVKMNKNDIFDKYKIHVDKNIRDLFFTSLEFANCHVAKYCFSTSAFERLFPTSVIEPDKNWTALYYTLVNEADSQMVQCIIENVPHRQNYIATLEVEDRVDGKSLLHLVIENGQIDTVDLLLDLGAPFDTADHSGNTQLHLAAQYGLNAIVKRLIEKGAIGSINAKNAANQTALYVATVGQGNLELVKYLLDLGANLDGDKDNNTLVNAATLGNKTDLVMHFISLGVDSVRANSNGETPLHYAAMNNNLELVNYFLDQDQIDVNVQTNEERTPLYYAIQYQGELDVVNSLLDRYATITPCYKCDSPLTVSIGQNKIEIAQTLLLAGADIHKSDRYSVGPVYEAIYSDNVEMAKLLFERGAYFYVDKSLIETLVEKSCDRAIKYFAYEFRDNQNWTMLHIMAGMNRVESVKILLERGAFVNAQGRWGYSPLHNAALDGQLEAVKMLCEMKQECINVELKDSGNQTALDLAQSQGHTDIVEFLKNWRPHSRARRQISEPFSEPPVASSSASRASWWVRDLISSAFGTFGSITKQTLMLSPSNHESRTASAQSISSLSASVNVHSTLLLLDVLARKITRQSYVGTNSQSISPLHARSYSLVIVEQFERMLIRLANDTNSELVTEFDSFELYRTVENCLLSGQYRKIDRILLSTARDAFSYDSVKDSLLVKSVEVLIEVLS